MTGGLVQQCEHQILPNITPFITFLLVVLSILVIIVSKCIQLIDFFYSFSHQLVFCGKEVIRTFPKYYLFDV